AAASATGSPFEGALFMALFGLGTAPMMLAIGMLPKFLSFGSRQKINQYLPIYTLFLAVFFVIRGLGLGIPYMSPQFEKSNTGQAITVCHTNKILK
ncbi:MAG: sulfite exporter TauE/SafE family protein, partial [Bacteroidota bacterium]